jgi:hypothetical protein
MKGLFLTYQFFVRLGIMKYFLYYLQIEHQVQALSLLRQWLDSVIANDPLMPISNRLYREVLALDERSGHWALLSWGDEAEFFFQDLESFCDEFYRFVQRNHGVSLEPDILRTLVVTQCAVTPRLHRDYPFVAELPHNIAGYFHQLKTVPSLHHLAGNYKPLKQYAKSSLKVTTYAARKSLRFEKIDGHSDDWEYKSRLRFY